MRPVPLAAALCTVLLVRACACAAAPSPPELVLVRDGKAAAAVLVPADAPGRAHNAARILAAHLEWMSGARLPLVREAEDAPFRAADGAVVPPKAAPDGIGAFVVVGDGELARALGAATDGLGPGGIRLRTAGNALVLTGSADDPYSTTYAVVELLERLGCRYLWPGDLGKVVPRRESVTVPHMDYRYTPPVGQRRIRNVAWRDLDRGLAWLGLSEEDVAAGRAAAGRREAALPAREGTWFRWHRLGGDLGIRGGHASCGLAGGWETWGKTHPEWFALQKDGTRDQTGARNRFRLCVSNPGLVEQVARDVIAKKRADPALKCVSLSPNDGGYSSFCMCEVCKALDPPDGPKVTLLIFEKVGESRREPVEYVSLTDRYVHFWNAVAERVAKVYPDLLMNADAYSAYQDAPVRHTLHPNLVVRFVPFDKAKWGAWRAKASRLFWRPNVLGRGKRTGVLHVYGTEMADLFHHFTATGMLATDFDCCHGHWAVQGMNYYVCARLNWNPALTYEAVLDDYCRSGFGPAAEPVKRYFRLAERTWRPELHDRKHPMAALNLAPDLLAELRGALAEADAAAAGDETVRRRIAFLRMGLNWNALLAALADLAQTAEQNQPYDRGRAEALMMLAGHTLRDMTRHWPHAVNAPNLMRQSGNFVPWRPLKWPQFLKEQVAAAAKGPALTGRLTGGENSFEEMMASLGLRGTPRP
jgi:hypothetical protein